MRITFEKLLQQYAAQERDFAGVHIILEDLREEGMFDINLSGANFRYANLKQIITCSQGINLSGADLRGINLEYAHFEEANLSGADLSYTNLWRACFDDANLIGADLSGAILDELFFGKLT